jgi:hypothetical protein
LFVFFRPENHPSAQSQTLSNDIYTNSNIDTSRPSYDLDTNGRYFNMHLYTNQAQFVNTKNVVKPAHVDTSIKQSPVLKVTFFLSCHRKFHMNLTSLRGHLSYKATFSLSQRDLLIQVSCTLENEKYFLLNEFYQCSWSFLYCIVVSSRGKGGD